MGKLLCSTGMMEPLKNKIQAGLPVWGTCAGMILLAKELVNDPVRHLGVMDIAVKRNAYGTQIDSFDVDVIRAPYITKTGEKVSVLCQVDGHVVAAREEHMLVTSFHPELTDCSAFHQYFAGMCQK